MTDHAVLRRRPKLMMLSAIQSMNGYYPLLPQVFVRWETMAPNGTVAHWHTTVGRHD